MITVAEAENIHSILIHKFGGSKGVRDGGLLESAINRPFATFEQTELYPEAIDKAAAILESILINHPFIDGNKRTGYVLARLLLMAHGCDIWASQDDKYKFVINISKGELRFEEIRHWLKVHVIQKV